jgi:hypothetical protein
MPVGAVSSVEHSAGQAAAADEATAIDPFVGVYRFSGGEREKQGIADAIDDVVSEMNILARGIARDRLTESNRAPSVLEVQRDGRRITVTFDDRTYTADLDGPAVDVTGSTGDPLKLTYRLRGDKLVQDFKGERGGRINTFSTDGEGTIRVQVKVHSTKLPKPLVYRLSFEKHG